MNDLAIWHWKRMADLEYKEKELELKEKELKVEKLRAELIKIEVGEGV